MKIEQHSKSRRRDMDIIFQRGTEGNVKKMELKKKGDPKNKIKVGKNNNKEGFEKMIDIRDLQKTWDKKENWHLTKQEKIKIDEFPMFLTSLQDMLANKNGFLSLYFLLAI